ncbi:MAG: thioredoxin domain-containing protein [Deltaproteobacteria bacterium]|nr:thioredoxin domain-containing protein [Deltaproteobacteria bacterium]
MRRMPILVPLLLCALAACGCREPAAKDVAEPDGAGFDAGEDDGGSTIGCPAGTPDLFNNSKSPSFGGSEKVDLEVVQFSWLRCPHCAALAELERGLWQGTRPDFEKRVRVYFHHFPGSDPVSPHIHASTVAAMNQGMESFWAMHDLIFDGLLASPSHYYETDELRDFAQNELGLDMDKYDADMADPATLELINWDKGQAEAQDVESTPAIFVCGKRIAASELEKIVDGYLGD